VITILAVAGPAVHLESAFVGNPSVEVLTAHDPEEALEKLARNRRIDAVLLFGARAAEAASLIIDEDPGAPPLYAPLASGTIPSVHSLPDAAPEEMVATLAARLQPPP
jgi:hypothetical protein